MTLYDSQFSIFKSNEYILLKTYTLHPKQHFYNGILRRIESKKIFI